MKCSVMGVICSRIWGVETSQKKLSFRLMAFPCAHISCLKFLLKISLCSSQDYRWYFSIQEKLNTLGTPAPKTYNKLMALVTTKKTKIEYLHNVSLFSSPTIFPLLQSTQMQFWFISLLWAQNQSVTKTGYITSNFFKDVADCIFARGEKNLQN